MKLYLDDHDYTHSLIFLREFIINFRKLHDGLSLDHSQVSYKMATVSRSLPYEKLTFRNSRYVPIKGDIHDTTTTTAAGTVEEISGRLHDVIAVKISILSMMKGTIPSIASLQIWGKPSNVNGNSPIALLSKNLISKWSTILSTGSDNTSAHDIKSTMSFYNSSITAPSPHNVETSDYNGASSDKQSTSPDDHDAIDEVLLDALTFTLMRNPVLLPSGRTVDQRTLDKYLLQQEIWGKLPCDPFTGVRFTQTYKPIPNVEVKLLLDKHSLNSRKRSRKYDIDLLTSKVSKRSRLDQPCSSSSSVLRHNDTALISLQKDIYTSNDSLTCCHCSTFLTSQIVQYKLPCNHIICRPCCIEMNLFRNQNSTPCPTCTEPFSNRTITRVNV